MALFRPIHVSDVGSDDEEYASLRTKAEEMREKMTKVAKLKNEVSQQANRANQLEAALQDANHRISELEIQNIKLTELQRALDVESSLCQHYRRELERATSSEGMHKLTSSPTPSSEGGITNELSAFGSEQAWELDKSPASDPGDTTQSITSLKAELEVLREENSLRTSQYVRAIARSAVLEQRTQHLLQVNEEQNKRLEMYETTIKQQRRELRSQAKEVEKHQQEIADLHHMMKESQPQRSNRASRRMNCFSFDLFKANCALPSPRTRPTEDPITPQPQPATPHGPRPTYPSVAPEVPKLRSHSAGKGLTRSNDSYNSVINPPSILPSPDCMSHQCSGCGADLRSRG